MIGYTHKDIDAVAMLRPTLATPANVQNYEVEKLIANAQLERSLFLGGLIKTIFGGTGRLLQKIAREYKSSREAFRAAEKLFAMSPRQLEDLGLSHGDIEAVVYGRKGKRSTLISGVVGGLKSLAGRIAQWQQARASYAELMALDDRALADLGICRGEIASVSKFGRSAVNAGLNDNANDNMNTTAANDDHRQAV